MPSSSPRLDVVMGSFSGEEAQALRVGTRRRKAELETDPREAWGGSVLMPSTQRRAKCEQGCLESVVALIRESKNQFPKSHTLPPPSL